MQWSDVTRAQTPKTLRQFGLLCLVVFGGLATWRIVRGQSDVVTVVLWIAALGPGLIGIIAPKALAPVFMAWMAVAFPIGFVVSRILLAMLYFLMFTPVAIVFRLMRRDVLRLERRSATTYWTSRAQDQDPVSYFRQS